MTWLVSMDETDDCEVIIQITKTFKIKGKQGKDYPVLVQDMGIGRGPAGLPASQLTALMNNFLKAILSFFTVHLIRLNCLHSINKDGPKCGVLPAKSNYSLSNISFYLNMYYIF